MNIRPPLLEAIADRYTNFLFPFRFQWWSINAPEMAIAISLKRLKNEARRDAMRNAGLDDIPGLQLADQAPNRANKAGITVIPALEACRTGPHSFFLQFTDHFRPQTFELRRQRGR